MVRRGLRGVWLRGTLPAGPFVWAANHHTWWDPFLAAVVLDAADRTPGLVMLQANLERYRFARRLGVFGTGEPRRGLDLLAEGRVLVVYPEGELRPPGRVGDLSRGAAWYARRAGVPLCAVATRVALRGHEAPEAYLSLSPVATTGSAADGTGRLRAALDRDLSDMDHLIASTDPRRPLPGFGRRVAGRRSWDERIDAMSGWPPWRS
jgi:1-acyl-sn-glycerol-3-phosphate acyltransferase